ncbi:MAG: HAD-IG family 5'-nucleotidase [Planctomycetota bacterium]|nr:HAD-IG family 5'-nucleotidase [Planctomycetota bacterium]
MSDADLGWNPPAERRVYCNRTLNMRSIHAVGFDMDYTLVHYDVVAWEARAYEHVRQRLAERGLPVEDLAFDAQQFARGLVIDLQEGNIVKANRFGYVTQASHGTTMLTHEQQRAAYSQVWIDLSEPRWVFLNTLFSLSESCLYGQLVDRFDRGDITGIDDYRALYQTVNEQINAAHLEGQLKAEIVAAPERFVDLDPDLPQTLLDLKRAGKKLFLATNSEWHYTRPIMRHVFNGRLGDLGWRDLFDLVIVEAKKPAFFERRAPFFEVLDDDGNERPAEAPLRAGAIYRGGDAEAVQQHLGMDGGEILYVGDHVYADVHVTSRIRRWRTALVLRELEDEVLAEQLFGVEQRQLEDLMREKVALDEEQAALRLALLRVEHGDDPPPSLPQGQDALHDRLRELRQVTEALDERISPLAQAANQLGHSRWGLAMRAGIDKSRLAREIEGHADIYTSRVSNLMHVTPYGYLRGPRGSLAHDAR